MGRIPIPVSILWRAHLLTFRVDVAAHAEDAHDPGCGRCARSTGGLGDHGGAGTSFGEEAGGDGGGEGEEHEGELHLDGLLGQLVVLGLLELLDGESCSCRLFDEVVEFGLNGEEQSRRDDRDVSSIFLDSPCGYIPDASCLRFQPMGQSYLPAYSILLECTDKR